MLVLERETVDKVYSIIISVKENVRNFTIVLVNYIILCITKHTCG